MKRIISAKPALAALAAACLALFSLSAASAAAEAAKTITVNDSQGAVQVPLRPQRVIVYDLGVLDNLNRLGVKTIVGVPNEYSLPPYLKQYDSKDYVKAGTLFEPDYETVAALKPDLILVAARSQPKYKDLARLAPTLDLTVSKDHSIRDMQRNITLLGQIFGKEKQAEAENADLNKAMAALRAKAASQGTGLLLLTTGGKTNAFGPGSRFGIVYDDFGLKPADTNIIFGKHGQPVSPEYILEKNPDWIIAVDRDAAIGAQGASAKQILNNPIVNKTVAAQKGQIVYFDPSWYLDSGGLTVIREIISQLDSAFSKSPQK